MELEKLIPDTYEKSVYDIDYMNYMKMVLNLRSLMLTVQFYLLMIKKFQIN